MKFNIISVALLSIVACLIILEIIRAINRGFKKTIVSLSSIFASVFLSIVITNFVSDLITVPLVKIVDSKFQIAQRIEDIPSINEILFAYVDAAISPIVFLVLFIVIRILISIILTIVLKKQEKKKVVRLYENEDAPEYKKRPKVLSALLGAFCGFLLSVVFISPFMGTLKVGTGVLRTFNSEDSSIKISFNNSFVKLIDVCSKDAVGNVVYYCGGNLIYKSVATSNLNENYFALEKEAKATVVSAGNIFKTGNFFNNIKC